MGMLADRLHAAQPRVCPPPRLARVHARAQVLLRLHLQVEPQLLPRLGILSSAPEDAAQPRDQVGKQAHSDPPREGAGSLGRFRACALGVRRRPRPEPHSARSTRIGSTRIAARAGRQQA
ncbi:MAG: hypothetical protein OXQ28_00975, partial [Acidobacteriota bacterium]|nr:hypothetical protein [Acidobacteriota bacterium]